MICGRLTPSASRMSAPALPTCSVAVAIASLVVGVATLGISAAAMGECGYRGERKDSGDHEGNDFHQATPCLVFVGGTCHCTRLWPIASMQQELAISRGTDPMKGAVDPFPASSDRFLWSVVRADFLQREYSAP